MNFREYMRFHFVGGPFWNSRENRGSEITWDEFELKGYFCFSSVTDWTSGEILDGFIVLLDETQ